MYVIYRNEIIYTFIGINEKLQSKESLNKANKNKQELKDTDFVKLSFHHGAISLDRKMIYC